MRYKSEQLLDAKMKAVMAEFGYKEGNVSVVCQCESPKEAQEMAMSAGLGSKWFLPECCEEMKDDEGLDLFKDSNIAICVDGKNFLKIDDIRDALLR
jgi:hypothetical protein